MDAIFETKRLLVRPLGSGDVDACFAVYGDPEVTRYVTPGGQAAPSPEWVRSQIEGGMLAPQEDARFGFWGVEHRADGRLVGTVALIPVEDVEDEFEMGWHLARAFWGEGYAFESGIGLLRYGFEEVGLERILALAFPENERSIRACRRLGMAPLGRRMHQGRDHECFAADRASWSPPASLD